MVCTARQIGHHASLERIAATSKVVEHTHPSTTIAIGLACGTARRRWKQEIIEVGNALVQLEERQNEQVFAAFEIGYRFPGPSETQPNSCSRINL